MRPSEDEVYQAFITSTSENIPDSVKLIRNITNTYISKIKTSIYDLVLIDEEGRIYLDFTKQKVNTIIIDFIQKQGLLIKPIIKPIMKSNYIDNIDNFVKSVKEGKNKYDKTVNTLTNIFSEMFNKLSVEHQTIEDKDTISIKIKNIFI